MKTTSKSVVYNLTDFAGIKKTFTAHKQGTRFKSIQSAISDFYIDETGRYLTNTPSNSLIFNEIKAIKNMLAELQTNIDDIHKAICEPPCIELRDINYEQARKEIELFFKENHGKEYYPSDLMEMLGIDFHLAARICNDLETEGKIQ